MVDDLINELDGRWGTQHERLMRIFLANTRARRMNTSVVSMGIPLATTEHGRIWSPTVIVDGAPRGLCDSELHLHDTSRARIENQLIDVAASRVVSGLDLPGEWRVIIEDITDHPSPVLVDESNLPTFEFHFDDGSRCFIGGDGFDAVARLRRHRALGTESLPPELEILRGSTRVSLGSGAPGFVAHPWFIWFEQAALLALEQGTPLPLPDRDESSGLPLGWSHLMNPGSGIMNILALRSRVVFETLGFEMPPAPEHAGTGSLAALHRDLASRPSEVLTRAPY